MFSGCFVESFCSLDVCSLDVLLKAFVLWMYVLWMFCFVLLFSGCMFRTKGLDNRITSLDEKTSTQMFEVI